jgi:prolyl 4-hydroxylase
MNIITITVPQTLLSFLFLYCSEIHLGETQRIDSKRAEEVHARIAAAKEYLATVVAKDPEISPFLEHCQLTHQDCAYWAVLGECEANPGYMKTKCAPVCGTCDQLDIKKRCPIDLETMPNTWEPGDVNEFFTNLTTLEKFQKYEPRILARPDYPTGDSEETADYMVNAPWVVVLENFLSQDEAERLIHLGMEEGYERSSDVGEIKYDGSHEHNVNNGRTSYNSWCSGVCYNDTVVKGVIDRITDLTNIPEVNSEWLQMLRYEEGEYYRSHHDYIEHQIDRQDGVRILTVYLYLNDLDEEEGGGTQFTNLGGLTVQPKRGRALLWPSVLDEDPHMKDRRTMHQALPVTKGSGAVKYGANAWIHQVCCTDITKSAGD